MAGREKIKCYHYDSNGKFIKIYNSINEIRDEYFNDLNGKMPLFRNNALYQPLPDGSLVCKMRLGRDEIRRIFVVENNPIVNIKSSKTSDIPIEVLNITGAKIASFANKKVMQLLTGMTINSINSLLREKVGHMPKNKLGISLRYIK